MPVSGRAITYHLIFQTLQQFILVQNMFVPSNPLLINLENCLVLENVFNMKVTEETVHEKIKNMVQTLWNAFLDIKKVFNLYKNGGLQTSYRVFNNV